MSITYANVTSTLALVIALGGTSYAATQLTGSDIKNGSLTAADLKRSTLTGAQIKDRSLGPRDFTADARSALQGEAGPAGAKGDAGTIGFQGDRGVQGEKGLRGEQGLKGSDCPSSDPACHGPKGDKGDQGDPGADATFDGLVAGGALTGTFPNPTIAPNAINADQIDRVGLAKRWTDVLNGGVPALPSDTIVRGWFALRGNNQQDTDSITFPFPLQVNGVGVDGVGNCDAVLSHRRGRICLHPLTNSSTYTDLAALEWDQYGMAISASPGPDDGFLGVFGRWEYTAP